jgi:hypothetical protein
MSENNLKIKLSLRISHGPYIYKDDILSGATINTRVRNDGSEIVTQEAGGK